VPKHNLHDCHMLEGAPHFVPWKCRLQNQLQEVEQSYLVEKEGVLPTYPKDLAKHNRKLIKEKQIVLDSVENHLIPHITKKKMNREMHIALVTL
jgi:hypothetical protein